MHVTFNPTDPISLASALALLVLLVCQVVLLIRQKNGSRGRRVGRAALNALLWLALAAYLGQVSWPISRPATHALLVGAGVPPAYARHLQDSLHIRDRFTAGTLKTVPDSVVLVGQDFPVETLARLSQAVLSWIPYHAPNRVRSLRWSAVLRQGEMQRVTGMVQSETPQLLRIQYGAHTLDSLQVLPGTTPFALQFPVFGRGRIQTELFLGGQPLDTIRFFGRKTMPFRVQFLLDNPDFESKTLAAWLGKQGHSVQLSTTLAKNVRSQVSINNRLSGPAQKPDLVITNPGNLASGAVGNALASGKAVLFINLNQPPADITAINRVLGTRWQLRRTASQETVPAGNGLTAHPYQFMDKPNQFAVRGWPVAVQQTAGRVGVSLLSETFPLALRGDSVAYSQLWQGVLTRLRPTEKDNIIIDAPVFSNLPANLRVNNSGLPVLQLRVGADTVMMTTSPLNRQSAGGVLLTEQTGWQTVQDSLAVWITPAINHDPAVARQRVSQFMLAHARYPVTPSGPARPARQTLPGWAWFWLLLVCLTALWIEPKIG